MAKDLDWENLSFEYMDTGAFVKVSFKDGAWGKPQIIKDPMISLHVAATALHYGQAAFEGLKVFTKKDGTVAAFRPEENAKRLNSSARRLIMSELPIEIFNEVLQLVVNENIEFVPPYGTGASMYIRPLIIGSGPRVGVQPADSYDFYMLAMPVGPYYKTGFNPVNAFVQTDFDRAAPNGVGSVKAGGNYAAGMMGDRVGKSKGYPISLYLDAAQHKYIDEFGTSNFIAITNDKKYVTPKSTSILPSITNASLQVLAEDLGLTVDKRPIEYDEISSFKEVGACGTAAVITPVYSITRGDKTITFGSETQAGETLTTLYNELQGIQYGDIEDRHGWMVKLA